MDARTIQMLRVWRKPDENYESHSPEENVESTNPHLNSMNKNLTFGLITYFPDKTVK